MVIAKPLTNLTRRNKMKYQQGYTIIELVIAIGGIVVFCGILLGAYVLSHFIMKFW
jgi:hypothetical protein